MLIYLGLVLLAFGCWFFPGWMQLLLFAINFLVPDFLPFADEVIQAIGMVKRFCDWVDEK